MPRSARSAAVLAVTILVAHAVPLALAGGATPARASDLIELGGGRSWESGRDGRDLTGVHASLDPAPRSWGAAVVRFDVARGRLAHFASLTVGPRLGAVRGRVRPYVDAGLGIATGTLDGAGFVAGCGAGARAPIRGRVGAFVYVRALAAANLDRSSGLGEWRLGLTLLRAPEAAETAAAP